MSMVVGECKYMRVVPEKLKILIDQEPWQPVDVFIYIYLCICICKCICICICIYIYIYISINKYTC